MKFISSVLLLVAVQIISARRSFFRFGGDNIAKINNIANSDASALAVNAGVFGDANANAVSAATNVNNVRQRNY